MKLTNNTLINAVKSMKTGTPPAGLAEKAREAAERYAADNGLSIEQVGVRGTALGTVKAFTIGEDNAPA